MRCLSLLAALLLPACVTSPPPSEPEALGPLSLTTWSDGAVTADLPVYVQDADGVLRAGARSDAAGRVTVSVGDGWAVTVVDTAGGMRRVHTVVGVSPGARLDLGDRRPVGDAAPDELRIAGRAPVPGGGGYAVSVCGPTITTTQVAEVAAEATVYYRPSTLDADGGALVIAQAEGTGQVAVVDVPDVAALAAPVAFPAWSDAQATATWFVGAPPGAADLEVHVHGPHGCVIGDGAGPGPEIATTSYPGLPVEELVATAWYRQDESGASHAERRVRAAGLPEPVLDLTDPPARVDDVAVQATTDALQVAWRERDDDGRGDGVVVTTSPSPDTVWTLIAPRGATHLLLPAVPDVQPAAPAWTTVTLVDLDDVDGYDELVARAGLPLTDPGWSSTGTRLLW